MTIGFVGFGEAAAAIAEGLHEEGAEKMICFDAMQDDPRFAEKLAAKRTKAQAARKETSAEVCRAAEVVIAAVPSGFALSAAREAVSGLTAGTVYVDVSTATPAEKKRIAALVEEKGGRFVDGAMMGTLLKDRHQVPTLCCGSGAREYLEMMAPFHMRLTYVEGEPGTATSIKFIRSITAKGISCLLFESLQAAQRYGVEDTIVESFLDSFGPGFEKIINGYVSGAIIHADRREHELQNVVDFLKEDGLPYTMAEATREKLAWIRDTGIKDRFPNGEVGRTWQDVLAGWNVNKA